MRRQEGPLLSHPRRRDGQDPFPGRGRRQGPLLGDRSGRTLGIAIMYCLECDIGSTVRWDRARNRFILR
jgi:hypothetical protein